MAKPKHGQSDNPLYVVWSDMMRRCYSEKSFGYPNYGGRGVTVCDEWKNDVKSFCKWGVENNWKKGLQLDKDIIYCRIYGGKLGKIYSPDFCMFVTKKQNAMYRSNSRIIEYNGENKSLPEWCVDLKLDYPLMQSRFKNGWSAERMFSKKEPRVPALFKYKGESKTLFEWGQVVGIKRTTLNNRLGKGWTIEEALETELSLKHVNAQL